MCPGVCAPAVGARSRGGGPWTGDGGMGTCPSALEVGPPGAQSLPERPGPFAGPGSGGRGRRACARRRWERDGAAAGRGARARRAEAGWSGKTGAPAWADSVTAPPLGSPCLLPGVPRAALQSGARLLLEVWCYSVRH